VNICPLDPFKNEKILLKDDPKCTLRKSIRLKLGRDLPNLGLSNFELKARKRWESLGQFEKDSIIARAKANLSKKADKNASNWPKTAFKKESLK
jgi:hypothetical protein